MISIIINHHTKLVSDANGYALQELRGKKRNKDGSFGDNWVSVRWYGNINDLLRSLPDYLTRNSDSQTLGELRSTYKHFTNWIKQEVARDSEEQEGHARGDEGIAHKRPKGVRVL